MYTGAIDTCFIKGNLTWLDNAVTHLINYWPLCDTTKFMETQDQYHHDMKITLKQNSKAHAAE